MSFKKFQREAIARAQKEAAAYGCVVYPDPDRPYDGLGHPRLIILDPKTNAFTVHTMGGSPKNRDAMVKGVGNAARRKARALVGKGPDD